MIARLQARGPPRLNSIINPHARSDGTARRVDEQLDVLYCGKHIKVRISLQAKRPAEAWHTTTPAQE